MNKNKELEYQAIISELSEEEEHEEHSTAWKLAFADFQTVLMCLFLVLWLQGADAELLSKVSAEFNPSGNSVIHNSKSPVFQPETKTLLDKQVANQEDEIFRIRTNEIFEIIDRMNRMTNAPNFNVTKDFKELKITLADSFFESGSSTLLKASISKLIRVLGVAYRQKKEYFDMVDIEIHGYTDNIPLAGTQYKNNWDLASMRAIETIEALSKTGIEQSKFKAISHGEYEPIAPNDSTENRGKNRRIEIVIKRINK